MSVEQITDLITLPAAADLSTKQYLAADVNSSGQAAVVASLGARGIGVIYTNPATIGQSTTVAVGGVVKAMAGATVTAGDLVTAMANGRFQTASATHFIWGKAISGGANGAIISILLGSQPVI